MSQNESRRERALCFFPFRLCFFLFEFLTFYDDMLSKPSTTPPRPLHISRSWLHNLQDVFTCLIFLFPPQGSGHGRGEQPRLTRATCFAPVLWAVSSRTKLSTFFFFATKRVGCRGWGGVGRAPFKMTSACAGQSPQCQFPATEHMEC